MSNSSHAVPVTRWTPAVALCLLVLSEPSSAYRASLGTTTMTPAGPVQVDTCQGSTSGPPGLRYTGPWYCATADGSDTWVEHGDGQVWARADLADGSLRLTATADAGVHHLGIGDLLWISVPGLDPGERATLTFELRVDGGFGRAPNSALGQAGFGFGAHSGVFSPVPTDHVGASVAWRTAYDSNAWNTTAQPEEFLVFNPVGDWTVIDTDHFRVRIDIDGNDPTLGLWMQLSASGPADFAHTATVRFGDGPPLTFDSESGVMLSVPEPGRAALLGLGLLALTLGRRRRSER